jgi:hypothetical protein
MSALKGYFDESGDDSDPQHSALSVAGYLGPAEGWSAFDAEWRGVLRKFDVPYLHMRELQNRRGAFKSWAKGNPEADARAASFFGELAGVIGRAKLEAFGAVVVLSDLIRFNAGTGADVDAKALGIYACALGARERHSSAAMEFVLDRMEEGHAKVDLARRYTETDLYYPSVRDCPEFRVMPKDDPNGSQNTPALQAADALAWELRKNYELKRPWFESEDASPDSPEWGNSLFKWFLHDRLEHMREANVRSVPLGVDIMRRSLSVLSDVAPAEGIIWTYRTLVRSHETRNGLWQPASVE